MIRSEYLPFEFPVSLDEDEIEDYSQRFTDFMQA